MAHPLLQESIWFDKARVDDAERNYYERLTGGSKPSQQSPQQNKAPKSSSAPVNSIADEIARVRQHIKHSLQSVGNVVTSNQSSDNKELSTEIQQLKKQNSDLQAALQDLTAKVAKMEVRLLSLEKSSSTTNGVISQPKPTKPVESKSNKEAAKDDDDDDVDLFGSDEEDDQAANELREKRLQEYAAKKSKKPALVAKSSVVLDIKPWDDETDMGKMEKEVRSITLDGLTWGASKLVPLAYGIKKLQIVTIVEDDKVSIDLLQEKIEELEDLVQSVDIAAFNKL